MTEEEIINEMIEDTILATELLKEYKKDYYQRHKAHYHQLVAKWRKDNPIRAKAIADHWLAKYPHYQRNYSRKRKAVTEPLIFEFLDNGFSDDIDGFITYLRNRGVPEQHLNWFRKDIQKHL